MMMNQFRRLILSFIGALALAASARNLPPGDLYTSSVFTPPHSFTSGAEGPAVDKSGMVYAVNFAREGTVGIIRPDGTGEVFVELPGGSIGNGIRFDSRGNMMIADYTNHNILKVDMTTRQISVIAHEGYMSQPNDIAIDSKDRLYASDPDWKRRTGRIWRVDRDGTVTLLDSMKATTNGIEVSPDEKTLYVNAVPDVWAYELLPSGNLGKKRLLVSFPDYGMDGMRCDTRGNLYIARYGKGTVVKVSPEGKVLREITLTGKSPSNVAFGGKDGRTVYVTLQDQGNMEYFRVEDPGREWNMQK